MTFEWIMVMASSRRAANLAGDLSGAVADFGTFVPLVVGILATRQFDATGVLAGFGLFSVAVAVFYRRPVPVQPMKVVTALIIVGAVTPAQSMAAGIIIAAILLALVLTRLIGKIAEAVPASVIMGIQLGVGAHLALIGLRHVGADPAFGVSALLFLGALYLTRFRNLAGIAVLASASAASLAMAPDQLSAFAFSPGLPSLAWPAVGDFEEAAMTTVLPQLALTLSNAVLATASVAAIYFPEDANRMSATRLAASTGVLNLVLAPFGAIPMCHGSGGLVAQYGFGARTWVTPAVFGVFCLVLGIGFGPSARELLAVIPVAAVGAMLAIAGAEMAINRRFLDFSQGSRWVVVATGAVCVTANIAAGLAVGIVLEVLRRAYLRRAGDRAV